MLTFFTVEGKMSECSQKFQDATNEYLFFDESKTYEEAIKHCSNLSSGHWTLASLKPPTISYLAKKLVSLRDCSDGSEDYFYLDWNAGYLNGTWSNGDRISNGDHQALFGKQSYNEKFPCADFTPYLYENSKKLREIPCFHQKPFICAKALPPPTTNVVPGSNGSNNSQANVLPLIIGPLAGLLFLIIIALIIYKYRSRKAGPGVTSHMEDGTVPVGVNVSGGDFTRVTYGEFGLSLQKQKS